MEYIATDPEVDIRVVFDIQHSVCCMGKYGFTGKIEVRKFTNSFSGMQLNVAMEAQVDWLEFNLTTNFDGMKNGITKFKYEHVLGFNFAGAKKTTDSTYDHEPRGPVLAEGGPLSGRKTATTR